MINIFFVDDEPGICEAVNDLFEIEDCKLHTFTSPQEAIRQSTWYKPSIIIADFRMPKINGIELIHAIGKSATCYLISGELDLEVNDPAIKGVITKPFRISRLIEIIQAEIARTQ